MTGTFDQMKKQEKDMQINVQPVRLKPFLGMQSGVYLTILYALILALLVFLIAFLPGILKSGKRVTFVSAVEPAAVYVDSRYIGSAPVTAFVEPGSHEVLFKFEDIAEYHTTVEISHPVFLTWLFPRKQIVQSELFLSDIPAFRNYLTRMYASIIQWSQVIDYSQTYHYPPLFSQVARTAATAQNSMFSQTLFDFLNSALLFITSSTMLDDAKEALDILADASILTEDQLQAVRKEIQLLSPLFEQEKRTETIGEKPTEFSQQMSTTELSLADGQVPAIAGYQYEKADLVIGEQVSRSYPDVIRLGVKKHVEPFAISTTEISEYQWALFMEANPYWAKENIEQLQADGMVDSSYLAGMYPSTVIPSTRPVHNISWYAANAFCLWLSEVSEKQVSLPSQAQWELAASSVSSHGYQTSTVATAHPSGPVSMLGGYWEFTSDPFIPLERYLEQAEWWDAKAADIIVKGGSYLNDPNSINRATVGVLARNECSETAGFRVVWIDR